MTEPEQAAMQLPPGWGKAALQQIHDADPAAFHEASALDEDCCGHCCDAEVDPQPGHRFAVHVPDDAIPNGHGGWWVPGPAPGDGEPADLSGWTDAGYIDEAVPAAPALGLEPHHRRGKERTDEEAAKLADLDANLAEIRRRQPAVTPLHDNHLHISHGLSGVEVDL